MRFRRLFVSDLDGTLLGDDAALDRFCTWFAAHRRGVGLVYSSGRMFDSVVESIRSTALPEPELVIAGVGTEIRDYRTANRWRAWTAGFLDWDALRVRRILEGNSQLELQPEEFLSPYKVSYYAYDLDCGELADIDVVLAEAGLRTQIVYSSARDLDVLPAAAGKGEAAAFVARKWGVSLSNVIAAGDSGNDLSLLETAGCAIIVANAQQELQNVDGPAVYRSPYAYADGVIDGLRCWIGSSVQPELAQAAHE